MELMQSHVDIMSDHEIKKLKFNKYGRSVWNYRTIDATADFPVPGANVTIVQKGPMVFAVANGFASALGLKRDELPDDCVFKPPAEFTAQEDRRVRYIIYRRQFRKCLMHVTMDLARIDAMMAVLDPNPPKEVPLPPKKQSLPSATPDAIAAQVVRQLTPVIHQAVRQDTRIIMRTEILQQRRI